MNGSDKVGVAGITTYFFLKLTKYRPISINGGKVMNEQINQISGNSDISQHQFSKNRVPGLSFPGPEADKKGSHKYVIEKNLIVYEKYDRHGKLISKVPWSHKPIDKRA
jgi:hypothetical protein